MQFEKGHLYHIYNQGNNRQKIFFNRENYLFFLKKMRTYLLPYCDILAYCLMPNHFHFMVRVNETHRVTQSQKINQGLSQGLTKSQTLTSELRTLNDSIGIMLRSYTRAINKQQNRTGTLFRKDTKAECLTETNGITPSFYNSKYGTTIRIDNSEDQYQQVCFNYIHQNLVRAGLAKNETDWEFSSGVDYAGIRNGNLVNKKVAKEYIDF